jgi:HEAT repeat protein
LISTVTTAMSSKPKSSSTKSTSTSRGFDKELAEIEALSEALKAGARPNADQVEYLRNTLGHHNNFIVSKAARLVADAEIPALLPQVLAAFDRFFTDAAKTDPQCWAKNALSKAMVKLEHRSRDEYLRGIRHHQLEPVWGGQSDTAGALRGTCTHALVNCPGISDADLLTALLEPLTDNDKTVRMEAARAIAQVGGVSSALLLRLRALVGKDEPEVLGAVYSALLAVEGTSAIPLVAKALEEGDDTAAEAAFALADLRSAAALSPLLARLRAGADAWFTSVLLSAIALTRQPEATDFLLEIIARDAREAPEAIEAIGRIAPTAEVRARVERAVEQANSMRLRQAFRQHMPSIPE